MWVMTGTTRERILGDMGASTSTEVPNGFGLLISDMEHVVDDVRIAGLLADHAWELTVERMFGLARDDQTALVKLLLTGALITAVASHVPRLPRMRLSRADGMLGGSVAVTALGGLVGASAAAAPAAGALIALAVVGSGVRSAVAGSSRGLRELRHGVGVRYGHAAAARGR
jgi:hypothetical protein